MSVLTRISVCSLTGKGNGLNMFSIQFDLFNKVESRISWGVLGAQALPCTYHLQDTKGADRRAEQRGPRSLGRADNNRGADDSGRGGTEKAAALRRAGKKTGSWKPGLQQSVPKLREGSWEAPHCPQSQRAAAGRGERGVVAELLFISTSTMKTCLQLASAAIAAAFPQATSSPSHISGGRRQLFRQRVCG